MRSSATESFWKCYAELPPKVKKQAKEAYKTFENNPYHPGLRFKRIHSKRPIYSVRISKDYRAVGTQHNGGIVWFWIGSHSDYDRMVKQLKSI